MDRITNNANDRYALRTVPMTRYPQDNDGTHIALANREKGFPRMKNGGEGAVFEREQKCW
jgi:hypothetical protein